MPNNSPLPDTLAGLRQLLSQIELGHSPISLGASSRRVLAAMLEAPQQAAVATISELAEQQGVNPSTLSRLAQRLGYGRFSQLQELFRREMTEGSHFYSDQADRLLNAGEQGKLGVLVRLARQESSNIASLVEGIDAREFERAAQLICQAKRVRVYGQRQFYSLSTFIAYALGMLRQDVATLDAGRQGSGDTLAQLEPGDLVILASCFPYTRSVVKTAQVASARGMKIIAMTDSSSSPLLEHADCSFSVPNQSLFFSNSMCGFMLLSEALLSQVASLMGEAAVEALRDREALIQQFN